MVRAAFNRVLKMNKCIILSGVLVLLVACGGGSGSGSSSDNMAPAAEITFPPALSLTDSTEVTVTGTASDDDSEITVLRVNGFDATSSDGFSTWQVLVPLSSGDNILQVETSDIAKNSNMNAAQATIKHSISLKMPLAIAVDSANNRAFVTDSEMDAVAIVDLSSGIPTVLSDTSTPNGDNPLSNPGSIVLDSANDRLLVIDTDLASIIAVDINSGARTVFSDATTPDGVNPFGLPANLVLDSVNNRVLVTDAGLLSIIAVDLSSGARSIFSDATTPDAINPFAAPRSLVLERIKNRVLVTDSTLDSVIAVDLSNGQRTILSNATIPDASNPLDVPLAITLDSANNRALVTDFGLHAAIAVDLTTGARTILSDPTTPDSVLLLIFPASIALDSANNRALVADFNLFSGGNEAVIVAVDLTNGARSLLSARTPGPDKPLSRPTNIVLDKTNNRALVVDTALDALFSIDLTDGARSILSDGTTPNAVNLFDNPLGIVLDKDNNRALVSDFDTASSLGRLFAVDLVTGARTVFSDATTPNADNFLVSPVNFVLDAANNRFLVLDSGRDALLAVDTMTGSRTILSDDSIPDSSNQLNDPRDLVLDSTNNRVLVVDVNVGLEAYGAVIAIDLTTGARSILSLSNVPTGGIPDGNNPFDNPTGITLDSPNNRALVVDTALNAIIAVDLSSGARNIVSDATTPNAANPLNAPTGLILDTSINRFLVINSVSGTSGEILEINPDSGERVVFSK